MKIIFKAQRLSEIPCGDCRKRRGGSQGDKKDLENKLEKEE